MSDAAEADTFKDTLIDKYGDGLYDVLDDPVAYKDLVGSLPESVAEITAANMLIAEVLNGGFHQYFFNSYGITANEAIAGLKLTDQNLYHDLAVLAVARFGENFPLYRDERMDLVGENEGDGIAFSDLNDQFFSLDDEKQDQYFDRFEDFSKNLLDKLAN